MAKLVIKWLEFDCPKCQTTNHKKKEDYKDGQLITCYHCGHRFTEYEDDPLNTGDPQ